MFLNQSPVDLRGFVREREGSNPWQSAHHDVWPRVALPRGNELLQDPEDRVRLDLLLRLLDAGPGSTFKLFCPVIFT